MTYITPQSLGESLQILNKEVMKNTYFSMMVPRIYKNSCKGGEGLVFNL